MLEMSFSHHYLRNLIYSPILELFNILKVPQYSLVISKLSYSLTIPFRSYLQRKSP